MWFNNRPKEKISIRKYVQAGGRLFTKEEWKRAEGVEYEVATGRWLADTKELAAQIAGRAGIKGKGK
jgi:hypothetical protein